MFRLIPREESFFPLFDGAAKNVHEGALAMLEFLETFNDPAERAKRMKDIEHTGDRITHDTIERLNRTFITPFDREDIDRKSTRLNSSHSQISYAVFCLKKKKKK